MGERTFDSINESLSRIESKNDNVKQKASMNKLTRFLLSYLTV